MIRAGVFSTEPKDKRTNTFHLFSQIVTFAFLAN